MLQIKIGEQLIGMIEKGDAEGARTIIKQNALPTKLVLATTPKGVPFNVTLIFWQRNINSPDMIKMLIEETDVWEWYSQRILDIALQMDTIDFAKWILETKKVAKVGAGKTMWHAVSGRERELKLTNARPHDDDDEDYFQAHIAKKTKADDAFQGLKERMHPVGPPAAPGSKETQQLEDSKSNKT